RDAVDGDLNLSFAKNADLIVGVPVRRGLLARIQTCDVGLERDKGDGGLRLHEDRARASGRSDDGQRIGVNHRGAELARLVLLRSGERIGLRGAGCNVADEINDVVRGWRGAHVTRVVRIIRGEEGVAARAGVVDLSVDVEVHLACSDVDDLLPWVPMDGVGLLARRERGDVDFDLVHGDGWVVEDLAWA